MPQAQGSSVQCVTRELMTLTIDTDPVAILRLISNTQPKWSPIHLRPKTAPPDSLVKALNDPNNSNVAPFVRTFMLLRWMDDLQAIRMFCHMSDLAVKCRDRRPQYFHNLIRCFYDLCAILQPSGNLTTRLQCVSREEILDTVRQTTDMQKFKCLIPVMLYQFHTGVWVNVIPPWTNWRPVTTCDVGYIAVKRQRSRSAFTMEEVIVLFEASKEDTRSHALLRFYIHTACRNAAACELLVNNVWNADTKQCLPERVVMEKFGIQHRFPIDPRLAEALTAHILASGVTMYVFLNKWRKATGQSN